MTSNTLSSYNIRSFNQDTAALTSSASFVGQPDQNQMEATKDGSHSQQSCSFSSLNPVHSRTLHQASQQHPVMPYHHSSKTGRHPQLHHHHHHHHHQEHQQPVDAISGMQQFDPPAHSANSNLQSYGAVENPHGEESPFSGLGNKTRISNDYNNNGNNDDHLELNYRLQQETFRLSESEQHPEISLSQNYQTNGDSDYRYPALGYDIVQDANQTNHYLVYQSCEALQTEYQAQNNSVPNYQEIIQPPPPLNIPTFNQLDNHSRLSSLATPEQVTTTAIDADSAIKPISRTISQAHDLNYSQGSSFELKRSSVISVTYTGTVVNSDEHSNSGSSCVSLNDISYGDLYNFNVIEASNLPKTTSGPHELIIDHREANTSSGNLNQSNDNADADHKQRPRAPTRPNLKKANQKVRTKVNGKLWEFIRDLLLNEGTNPSFIKWERREDGVFKFVQSDKVAKMWGERKQNPKMTYEKLSRAMRYYYKSKVLLPVFGRRLVYKFGPNATGWKCNI